MEKESTQRILNAYKKRDTGVGESILGWGGLVGLIVGAVSDNLGASIAGATCWGLLSADEAIQYASATPPAILSQSWCTIP